MKKTIAMLSVIFMAGTVCAQTDSVKIEKKNDTIRIGGMVILKRGEPNEKRHVTVTMGNRREQKRNTNVSTSSMIVDLGFANWVDKTNYSQARADGYLLSKDAATPLTATDFKLRTVKSVNVNIWFFMQRLNLVKHYVNLKYGLGLELNNYRFNSNISFNEGPLDPYDPARNMSLNHPYVFRDSINFSKNKLAADYVTVPLMLNFRTNKNYSDKGISISAGVSAGYLYSSRNKQVSHERGKQKNRGDYDLEKWKFSYIAELGLGPAHLYGSYSPKSIFDNGLDFRPYTLGIRLSNW